MNGGQRVRLKRLEPAAPASHRERRWTRIWLLAAAWAVTGIVLVSQAKLPDLRAAADQPPAGRGGRVCWVVQVESADGPRVSLTRDLRQLRRAGLRAELWRGERWSGWRPKARLLIVLAPHGPAAASTRKRVVRMGFPDAVTRRLPPASCRPRR